MEEFIKPINPDQVAGKNIEYDEDYQKLLTLVQEKPEQQFGELIIDAKGPEWEGIYNLSSEILLHKSKDLNVMSYFTQSGIERYGLSGLAKGLEIIYKNLAQYWENIYPLLNDEDGDFDPDYRINSLSLFFSQEGILKSVRDAFLIKNGLSQAHFSVRDIESILDNSIDKYPGGVERLNIDLQIGSESNLIELNAIQASLASIEKIKKIFEQNLDSCTLKFDTLEQLLTKIIKNIKQDIQLNTTESTEIPKQTAVQITQPLNWSNYSINSRQDVELLLEKIFIYFEKNEPSHPAPLFIRRIQKLMSLNFYEIMKDISPEALDRLDILVGQQDNEFEN